MVLNDRCSLSKCDAGCGDARLDVRREGGRNCGGADAMSVQLARLLTYRLNGAAFGFLISILTFLTFLAFAGLSFRHPSGGITGAFLRVSK